MAPRPRLARARPPGDDGPPWQAMSVAEYTERMGHPPPDRQVLNYIECGVVRRGVVYRTTETETRTSTENRTRYDIEFQEASENESIAAEESTAAEESITGDEAYVDDAATTGTPTPNRDDPEEDPYAVTEDVLRTCHTPFLLFMELSRRDDDPMTVDQATAEWNRMPRASQDLYRDFWQRVQEAISENDEGVVTGFQFDLDLRQLSEADELVATNASVMRSSPSPPQAAPKAAPPTAPPPSPPSSPSPLETNPSPPQAAPKASPQTAPPPSLASPGATAKTPTGQSG